MASTLQKIESVASSRVNGGNPVPNAPQVFDFLDLKAQFRTIREQVIAAATTVLESQHFILGDEVRLFEEEVASALGAKHAVSCASGTDALILAMLAAGIGPGDEVLTTPFSFIATAGSIARVGARPVFVDIEPQSFNINPDGIDSAITSRTRAILPVHLFGLPADCDPILQLAEKLGLAVIEDAAQAIGARYKERSVGTIGTFGCFSFFPSKNLGGAGDGGLITTQDASLAERLRLLRVHGSKKKYHHDILGTNSRLDALQAAILRVKLKCLDGWTCGRQARANHYRSLFASHNLGAFLQLPCGPSSETYHVYNQFTIRCTHRDELRDFLKRAGIPTEVYYPLPLHLQPAFAYLGYREGQFPQAELASREVLSLPIYPELKESQQELVVGGIADFYSGAKRIEPPEVGQSTSVA
jgi:dTDP-4-amino-4,6-dideoxygalactose transaminase